MSKEEYCDIYCEFGSEKALRGLEDVWYQKFGMEFKDEIVIFEYCRTYIYIYIRTSTEIGREKDKLMKIEC